MLNTARPILMKKDQPTEVENIRQHGQNTNTNRYGFGVLRAL